MNSPRFTALCGLLFAACAAQAQPACPAEVLGTARTLTLPRAAAAYGRVQHAALPGLERGEVVLTFDDGPRPESTPKVLQALREQCVKATFLMNGGPLLQHLALARRTQAAGHSVGLHGFRHSHFGAMPAQDQLADLNAAEAAFRDAFGQSAPAYRFPFLEETPTLLGALAAGRTTVMSVDLGIDDWLPDQTPKMLADRLIERLAGTGGGIVLMHDAQDLTAAALPLMLQALKRHGYRVVHLRWQEPEPQVK